MHSVGDSPGSGVLQFYEFDVFFSENAVEDDRGPFRLIIRQAEEQLDQEKHHLSLTWIHQVLDLEVSGEADFLQRPIL